MKEAMGKSLEVKVFVLRFFKTLRVSQGEDSGRTSQNAESDCPQLWQMGLEMKIRQQQPDKHR